MARSSVKGHQALQLNSFLEKVSVRAKHGGGNPGDKVSTKAAKSGMTYLLCYSSCYPEVDPYLVGNIIELCL